MNIEIKGIPNNQKIKSIEFKIEFTNEETPNIETTIQPVSPVTSITQVSTEQEESTESLKAPEFDISDRAPKIADGIMDESF